MKTKEEKAAYDKANYAKPEVKEASASRSKARYATEEGKASKKQPVMHFMQLRKVKRPTLLLV
jgi:hypothetical protein